MVLRKKVTVVMPAYDAEQTLEKTYREIPHDVVDEIILVDDFSHDQTEELARSLGIRVFIHDGNFGCGRNQKTCYTEALKNEADIIVMLHPDYLHGASPFDSVLLSQNQSKGGAPFFHPLSPYLIPHKKVYTIVFGPQR